MTVTLDEAVLKRRLSRILVEVDSLKEVQIPVFKKFSSSWTDIRAAERALEIIAQAIIDVASHIVAQKRWGVPSTYRQTVLLLNTHGILPEDLTERLTDLIGMRNVLIHDYLEVNLRIVYDSVTMIIEDGPKFVRLVNEALKRSSGL
ncbi:MAG: DUF86 domain-containing protein [Candidatus Thorarchaeota archaeon]|nr:DUF86 domain-containing protein [Candidatus Thorarchaeota archaeon]